jgi:hypothetical protein
MEFMCSDMTCIDATSTCNGLKDCKDGSDEAPLNAACNGWTCDKKVYNDGLCDCGCGTVDPDCPNASVSSCDLCGSQGSCDEGGAGCLGIIDPNNNATCNVKLPAGWTCAAEKYIDPWCDCGCGVPDPACMDSKPASCENCGAQGSCSEGECPDGLNPIDNSQCLPVPQGWTCGASAAYDKLCDCGCGALDPACKDATSASCDECNPFGSCNKFFGSCKSIDPNDNTKCAPVPPAWTCTKEAYLDGSCDCGCGAPDLGCKDATVASCVICNDPGSCSTNECPGIIKDGVNWTCK